MTQAQYRELLDAIRAAWFEAMRENAPNIAAELHKVFSDVLVMRELELYA